MAHGEFKYAAGDLQAALKSFVRARDYSSAAAAGQTYLAIVRVCLELKHWSHVDVYANKIRSSAACKEDSCVIGHVPFPAQRAPPAPAAAVTGCCRRKCLWLAACPTWAAGTSTLPLTPWLTRRATWAAPLPPLPPWQTSRHTWPWQRSPPSHARS